MRNTVEPQQANYLPGMNAAVAKTQEMAMRSSRLRKKESM